MAAQGERELGDIVMGEGLLGPMVQDTIEQEIGGVEEEGFFTNCAFVWAFTIVNSHV